VFNYNTGSVDLLGVEPVYRQKMSQMDLLDLANCIRLNDPVEEIASFMCRSRREIREKIAELERSGELPGLIEKAAAEAVDEPEDDNDTQGETAT
jgi:hypothetical protein